MECQRLDVRPRNPQPINALRKHVIGEGIVGVAIGTKPTADRTKPDKPLQGIFLGRAGKMNATVHFGADAFGNFVGAFSIESSVLSRTGAMQNATDRPI